MRSAIQKYVAIFSVLLSFVGCGSGTQRDASMDNVAGGGIGGTGITSVGPITELGKTITVNGIKYEIDSSNVVISKKDLGKDTSGLKLGMVVKIEGKVNSDGLTGKADLINFDANVEGPVTSIDITTNTFVILGQIIVVDDKTVFEINSQIVASGLSLLKASDYVEISGLVGVNGSILATRVEKKTAQNGSEVKGMVKNLNNVNMTFNINNLLIDYSNAVLEKFVGDQIANGDFIQTKGVIDPNSGILIATKVEKEKVSVPNGNGFKFKVTGFVSSVDNNQLVILTASGTITIQMKETTKFSHGTVQNLIVGVKVEVEGNSVDSTLIAKEISFNDKGSDGNDDHDQNDDGTKLLETEIEEALDETPSNTTTLKISGITVDTTEAIFENENDVKVSRQTFFITLIAGTFVKVEGKMTGIDSLKATKVSLKKIDDD